MVLIQDTQLDRRQVNILIDGRTIKQISERIELPEHAEVQIIDGSDTAVFPTLVNGHTHSPMTLLRGYGDDMLLKPWLEECMWPVEAQYREDDFRIGYRLAFMEMIRSGTTYFNEMYMRPDIALEVLSEIPLRGHICFPIIDGCNPEVGKMQAEACEKFFETVEAPEGVDLGVALHAVYTDSLESIEWVRDFARAHDLKIHIHLSETEQEVEDCMAAHDGMSPVEYLESFGILSDRVLAAHTVWLSDHDMDLLAQRDVTVIHNPVSNMKLASGKAFPYEELRSRGIRMLLGTDGAASNNNLDLLEEMKIAALLQKHDYRDPTRMKAAEIFDMASSGGAEVFKTGSGRIEEGAVADLMLIDLMRPEMVPATNPVSNLVYSATSACVKTVICQGRILMDGFTIEGEAECLKDASRLTGELISRAVQRS